MNQTELLFPLIFISREDEPWGPIEPNPNAAAEDEAVTQESSFFPSDWVLASSETYTHEYLTQNAKVRAEIEFDDTDPRGFSGVPVPAVYPESISSALATGFALGSAMMYYGTAGGGLPSASRPRSYLCDR